MLEEERPQKEKKRSAVGTIASSIERLFGGFKKEQADNPMPMQGGYGDAYGKGSRLNPLQQEKQSPEDEKLIHAFPKHRFEQYGVLEDMIADPLNEAAITMHVSHALSSKTDTGEIVFVEAKTDDRKDKIVEDLRSTFSPILNANLMKWGFLTALYGYYAPRIYGEKGKGVTKIRDDFYTNPRFVKRFERAGEVAGFTHKYQAIAARDGLMPLIEPWKFVEFSVQQHTMPGIVEPMRNTIFDIERDDWWNDEAIETQAYGSSLMSTVYEPWMDFKDALLSLSVSRRNAAKRDRFVSINTGKAHPVKAAQYYNAMAEQFQRKATESARRGLSKGYVSTIDNHIFPVWSNGTGQVNIQTEDSPVDVSGIEDVMMHLNRVCAGHGLDKSLLGWGDSMAGGLGEGGFFRTAITAAIRGNQIRRAMLPGIERLFEIHVAYKYGKVFTEEEKPWKITFNSLNTAIQYEEAETQDKQAGYAASVATLMQMLDPEMERFNFDVSADYLFRDVLKMDGDTLSKLIKKQPKKSKNQSINDALAGFSEDEVKNFILDCLNE